MQARDILISFAFMAVFGFLIIDKYRSPHTSSQQVYIVDVLSIGNKARSGFEAEGQSRYQAQLSTAEFLGFVEDYLIENQDEGLVLESSAVISGQYEDISEIVYEEGMRRYNASQTKTLGGKS